MVQKIEVKKGARQKLKAALGLSAASGAGKTVAALLIAIGMMRKMFPDLTDEERWEKIGVLDTEHSRSLLYVNTNHVGYFIGEFLHVDLTAPFSVARYKEGVDALKAAGCEVIIVDSGSHVWAKEGGLLEAKAEFEKAPGKTSYTAWADIVPLENILHETLFMNDVHVITTMRAKQEYAMEMNDKGKMAPVKIGMKPVQRDDFEYEFMTVLNISMEHIATASKDNTGVFSGKAITITPEYGEQLYDWLEQGIDVRKLEREAAEKAKAERQAKIDEINSLASQYPAIRATIDEIVMKMKMNLEKFPDNALDRALGVTRMKLGEIEASKTAEETQTPQEVVEVVDPTQEAPKKGKAGAK